VTIDIEICNDGLGVTFGSNVISLSVHRANSRHKYNVKRLERKIEYFIEHESIHIILNSLFRNKTYGEIVSWLLDYIDYSPVNIIENHELPTRKIKLKEIIGIQECHRLARRIYLQKYFGKKVLFT
jgi:hypothetical protein